ncbi:MAG: sugar-phosphate kinase [Spirochaetes bacterium GWB1_59_5]|nr:MAG: sugar-phosphate kinase [Spirochaetes bacterium GWB1_59_5]
MRVEHRKTTLLGIGPMSKRIVRVSLLVAKKWDFPLMFIASRNQVDLKELGGGYVCAWDQAAFAATIREAASAAGYTGPCYLCRDHGGPWQRDEERRDNLPVEEAMDLAKRSYLEDLVRGFHLLHIDPTKDPLAGASVQLEAVTERTVGLIEYIEAQRRDRGLPEVAYEVGTEETSGGLTSAVTYESFIARLTSLLERKSLPRPIFIVGQTGTLTRLTQNVGRFDARAACALSDIAARHACGLKEHNADYLPDRILLGHPLLGVAAVNVAPEFGVAETDAYLQLAEAEQEVHRQGSIATFSDFYTLFSETSVRSERWRKWMTGETASIPTAQALENPQLREQITRVCGHYVFNDPGVKSCLDEMLAKLRGAGIDPEGYADGAVARSIERYARCLNLRGLTSSIAGERSLS